MLREVVQSGGEPGRKIAALIDRGQMVADETVFELVWERLSRPDTAAGFLLDGFPRTLAQAEALERFMGERGRLVTAVLDLQVGEEELIRRLSGRRVCPMCQATYHIDSQPPRVASRCDFDQTALEQRPDDRPEVIRHRLRLYWQRTAPVLEFYRLHGRLRSIDAGRPIDAVTHEIIDVLERENLRRVDGPPPPVLSLGTRSPAVPRADGAPVTDRS
jgi:adenylate kinase